MKPRYAVYFAPAQDSPWWQFGSHWLGRDACLNVNQIQPTLAEIGPGELHEITAQPRRYGFHATLKAPFSLRGSDSVADMTARLGALAATRKPIALGPMQALALGNFVAVMPTQAPNALMALAETCVTELDDLRAPLSEADLRRRRIELLDPREQELMRLFGYPYVMERFRFHLTLTGPLAQTTVQRVLQALAQPIERLNASAPLVLDRLCLFVEPAPDLPFQRVADMALSA